MLIKHFLQDQLSKVLNEKYTLDKDVQIDVPSQADFGDFATNVAFTIAKVERKSPMQLAQDIVAFLSDHPDLKDHYVFSALNGFVNIKLTPTAAWVLFSTHATAPTTFPSEKGKVLLEYVSANPTGPLHIGHGRWAVLGSIIANLLKSTQHNLSTEFYINDAGNQIENLLKSVQAVREGNPIPENGYHGAYIKDIAESSQDPLVYNLEHQKKTLSRLGVDFDVWYSEKSLHHSGAVTTTLEDLKNSGKTYESEGALWFKSTDYGDEKDRVLVKNDGNYTYFVADIAYHHDKVNRGFDKLINIFGADHHGYVSRIKGAVAALHGDKFISNDHFHVVIGQLVSLKRDGEPVRMSKRTGDMISLEEVVDEIGPDAVRYFLSEKSSDTHVDFDLALAVKKSSENPVFYVQYAHARLASMLRKAAENGISCSEKPTINTLDPKEHELILQVLKQPEALWEAAKALAPHKFVHYCYELARSIQHFYEACPVLTAEQAEQQKRLHIITLTKEVLAKSLAVLGISAPEAM